MQQAGLVISRSSLFKLVFRGWFSGVLVIFVPIGVLAIVAIVLRGSWDQLFEALLGLAMMPLIAAGQGVVAGGLVVLGLTVRPPKQTRNGDVPAA